MKERLAAVAQDCLTLGLQGVEALVATLPRQTFQLQEGDNADSTDILLGQAVMYKKSRIRVTCLLLVTILSLHVSSFPCISDRMRQESQHSLQFLTPLFAQIGARVSRDAKLETHLVLVYSKAQLD